MAAEIYRWQTDGQDRKVQVLVTPDGMQIATARRRQWWSSVVEFSFPDGRTFTMLRPSPWRSAVSIRDGSGQEAGACEATWWSSQATLRWNNASYVWKSQRWWSGKRTWTDEQGNDVFLFTPIWRWSGSIDAEVERFHPSSDDVMLLAVGWYLLFLGAMDGTTAATMTAAAS